MILRIDRLQTELPPPSDPDPAGAAVVQELLGGKFGEMSTFMNYTYQSFNFRARQQARPFYDLVASIAAEEFGHIELVSTAINTMLTGCRRRRARRLPRRPSPASRASANPQQFIARRRVRAGAGLQRQALERRLRQRHGRPRSRTSRWNFFLETGARNNKLKVYEMVEHPAARALTGYLLVRGGVHQIAYARAVENLTGVDLMKLFPSPRIPTDKIPECQPHIERGEHTEALPLLAERLPGDRRRVQRPAPGDGRGAHRRRGAAPRGRAGVRPARAGGRVRPQRRARARSPRSPSACARPPACPRSRPASSPRTPTATASSGKVKEAISLMAELTKLESKLAEVIGLAGAAKDSADKVKGMLDEDEQGFAATLDRMKEEAVETEERATAVVSGFDGKKTAILDEARTVRGDAREMMKTYLEGEDEALDGFELLTMAEAGEVGHWAILRKLNERAGNAAVRELTDWAVPVQEDHLKVVLESALAIAAAEDPQEEA